MSGAARDLALAMNTVVLRHGAPEDVGDSRLDTWQQLDRIAVPVTVAWGALDVPFLVQRYQQLAQKLPHSRTQILHGHAHLPYLENPLAVAELIAAAR